MSKESVAIGSGVGAAFGILLCFALYVTSDNGALRRELWHQKDALGKAEGEWHWNRDELVKERNRHADTLVKYNAMLEAAKNPEAAR